MILKPIEVGLKELRHFQFLNMLFAFALCTMVR